MSNIQQRNERIKLLKIKAPKEYEEWLEPLVNKINKIIEHVNEHPTEDK